MFDLSLNEDISMIQDVVRRFATDMLSENYRDFEADKAIPESVLSAYAEMGLASLEVPESLGGAALGSTAKAVILEELGFGDPGAALALDGIGPALYAVADVGGDSALEEYIVSLLDKPDARALLIWDDGPQPSASSLRYLDKGSEPGYQGLIPWVPANHADLVVVLDHNGASVITQGFSINPVKGSGLRAAGAGELVFGDENNPVPIAKRWDNKAGAAKALARWQLYTAALMIGVFRVAAETSREYAMERVAFGKPIAHHQAIAFLIADMRTVVDGARLLVQDAASRADADQPFESAAAAAFVEVVEASMFITPNALQIFGGQGFMQDLPLEKYMREARTLGLMAGGVDLAREIAGRDICANEGLVELSALAAQDA
ncbi:MAG: acyl-CoA dehydrogenase family protein [Porticoccaceae bacterium]|nr:acyl-CoA dehydrogenase family protein [Porticoccaceae bacterium]